MEVQGGLQSHPAFVGAPNTAANDLNTLRVTKAAFEESLVSEEDYNAVKSAFLTAQSIKAGLDAGFITRDDYNAARHAFFQSMTWSADSSQPGSFPAASVSQATTSTAATAASAVKPPVPPQPPHDRPAVPPLPLAQVTNAAQAGPQSERGSQPSQLPSQPNASGSKSARTANIASIAALPSFSGSTPRPAGEKKSMSGIAINPECVTLFNYVKARKALRWMMFKISDDGTEVVLDQQGGPESSYNEFLAAFPSNECRFAVYDYEYVNNVGERWSKLCFVHWSPDSSTIKNKIMYASTKDALKSQLDGISAEIMATESDELDVGEMHKSVSLSVARA